VAGVHLVAQLRIVFVSASTLKHRMRSVPSRWRISLFTAGVRMPDIALVAAFVRR